MLSREWLFRRNCSITPRQLCLFYASLSSVSFAVAAYFTFHGAWFVLVFAFLEMSAVAAAFLVYARHATDRERIALNGECLLVELIQCDRATQFKLNPRLIRVRPPARYRDLIRLDGPDAGIEVGRYLTESKRREFARELTMEMRAAIR